MKTIKIKDLEIVEQERQQAEQPSQNIAKAIAELAVKNAQKDIAITQMAQTIAQLNIELKTIKGEVGL